MKIDLAYGKKGLIIEVPESQTTVIEPIYLPGLPDVNGSLVNAMRNPVGSLPLRQSVKPNDSVAISVCDITRPMPSSTVLPVLLKELGHVNRENISILVATGTHRSNNREELVNMLGEEVVNSYRVINHSAFKQDELTYVGVTSTDIPIWMNKTWMQSDVRITTGFVEPHFFAGFSGGPKMVAPGLAGFKTIMGLHSASLISNQNSTWAITEGNPIHDQIREIAVKTGVTFSIDVTINRDHQITSCYAGDLLKVHRAACDGARRNAMRSVPQLYDIVITTNSGFPLDMNLYQAVKGMSAASLVAKDGGVIICAAECSDGIPEHGEYGNMLMSRDTPGELLEMIHAWTDGHHDQWQVQIQSQLLMKNQIYLKSSYLTNDQIKSAHLKPVTDIQHTLNHLVNVKGGKDCTICVLPLGPQTIPFLKI